MFHMFVKSFVKIKSFLIIKWEDKLREECARLKQDLCRLQVEEKRLAVESMKLQKEQEISTAKQSWERARQDLVQEVWLQVLHMNTKIIHKY